MLRAASISYHIWTTIVFLSRIILQGNQLGIVNSNGKKDYQLGLSSKQELR